MKKLSKMLIICSIISIIMPVVIMRAEAADSAYIVMDSNSGRVFYEENAREKKPIASLTKIATCITAIENSSLDDKVCIKKEWTNVEGSSVYLQESEELTMEELLYALMLRSGNDAATAICGHVCDGGNDFVSLMNDTAKRLGLNDTHFENPHGLDSPDHYSSASDLALLCSYSMANETFAKIVSTKKMRIGSGESLRVLINKNKLLSRYEFAEGIKTGYTKKSGRCLASAANKDGFRLVCVVLNLGSTYETTEMLFDKVYSQYNNRVLHSKDEPVAYYEKDGKTIPCSLGKDAVYPLSDEEMKYISSTTEITYKGGFPVKSGTEMGIIKFYLKNQLLFEQKIYSILG